MISGADLTPLSSRVGPIYLEGRLPIFEAPAVAALGLRDGQVVRPLVEARDGQLQLLLQGVLIPVPPQLRLVAGERPAWTVRLDTQGRATLVPLGDAAQAPDAAPATPATAGRLEQLALRPPALSGLAALMQPGALAALFQAAPQAEVGAQIAQFLRPWIHTSQITPDGLRRALRQGGWTQEAALARGDRTATTGVPDTKSLLRTLLAEWTQAPAATRGLLQDALDDIESRQLQSVVDPSAGRELALAMLLPFADAEPVHVRWSRAREGHEGGAGGEGGPAPWVVDLHTRSSEMGEVWLRTRISQRTRVELVMWAQRPELAAQARAATPSLVAWLNEAGLRMVSLQVIHGEPPPGIEPSGPATGGDPGRLVDVSA
ncbi:MAG: hypothetical protein ACOVK6_00565 [Ramlibacter sp.]